MQQKGFPTTLSWTKNRSGLKCDLNMFVTCLKMRRVIGKALKIQVFVRKTRKICQIQNETTFLICAWLFAITFRGVTHTKKNFVWNCSTCMVDPLRSLDRGAECMTNPHYFFLLNIFGLNIYPVNRRFMYFRSMRTNARL